MKIRYSSNGEVSIEGSRKEMEGLSKDICEFTGSENKFFHILLVTDYDPSPYEQVIKILKFLKANENTIEVKDDLLIFSGENAFFESVAKNLPYGVEETPYHIHYDPISFPQFLKPEAPEIVFEATH